MISRLGDFAPEGTSAGVGLALQDDAGRFVVCIGGTRYRCPPGQRYFMGIGGHREPGETWLDCGRREAREEVGADVSLMDADRTWHLALDGTIETLRLADPLRPLALYEMAPPPGAPDPATYRLLIFRSRLITPAAGLRLGPIEVGGVLALAAEHLAGCVHAPRSLGSLLASGAELLAQAETIDRRLVMVPIGTARALGTLFQRVPDLAG